MLPTLRITVCRLCGARINLAYRAHDPARVEATGGLWNARARSDEPDVCAVCAPEDAPLLTPLPVPLKV